MSVVDAIRRKYKTFLPKPREVVDPDTGEVISSLSPTGGEILDPTPIAPPVGFSQQPSMAEYIRDLIRSEKLAQEAAEAGMETFEESEDFDIDDDFDPTTPYEAEFDPEFQDAKQQLIDEHKRGVKGQEPLPGEPPAPTPEPKAPKPEPKATSPGQEDGEASST